MIISQTPLRMSFFGGGTDFKDYYEQYGGFVISACIDKFIYFIVSPRNDDYIVLNYSEREMVYDVESIKHDIFREALKLLNITKSIEIVSISDITSKGSGLASSSAFTVGLLNALYAYKGVRKEPKELAEIACKIEIEILGNPIGKQDQYSVAYGGLKKYCFNKNGSVTVSSIDFQANKIKEFANNILLVDTGITRKSSEILYEQKLKIEFNIEHLHSIKETAILSQKYFENFHLDKLGELLSNSWENKKFLAHNISNKKIDKIYKVGKEAGAFGGKLLGAGGGGFFLFICPPEKQVDIKNSLRDYQFPQIKLIDFGSRIILET